jgi:hypothetical protein
MIESKINPSYNPKKYRLIHIGKVFVHVPVGYIKHEASIMTELLVPSDVILILIFVITSKFV